jgi:hypothetical protein
MAFCSGTGGMGERGNAETVCAAKITATMTNQLKTRVRVFMLFRVLGHFCKK